MSDELLTGIIQTETKPIIFSAPKNSFIFSFMTDSMHVFPKRAETVKIPTSDGFIYGKTHSNYDIAIYLGNKSFEVSGKAAMNTAAYVKSCANGIEQDIREFETISFKGGTLNSVFNIDAMNIDHCDGALVIRANDDSIKYSFHTETEEINVCIRSEIREQFGVQGNAIVNNDVILTIEFEKRQPLSRAFECYNGIKNLLSFLTFRYNVGFDDIYISNTHPKVQERIKIADIYIRSDYELTSKREFDNIHFNEIINQLPALTKMFFGTDDEDLTEIGFYPKNDQDLSFMSDAKLREICSALECELKYVDDIKAKENKLLNELIDLTRKAIKNFRRENKGLSNDTYNMIFSSIGYWSFSLAEKLCALYHKYEEEMTVLNVTDITINDTLIKSFVKYRNDITHGRHRIPDIEIAVTAHYLSGLVYCCILERVGVDRKNILKFCKDKLLK